MPVPEIATVSCVIILYTSTEFCHQKSFLIQAVQAGGQTLGEAYMRTNFPTEQLGSFIRLCLTDANFPGFVEAVEKELSVTANTR